jgi:hypothetical protein
VAAAGKVPDAAARAPPAIATPLTSRRRRDVSVGGIDGTIVLSIRLPNSEKTREEFRFSRSPFLVITEDLQFQFPLSQEKTLVEFGEILPLSAVNSEETPHPSLHARASFVPG